ncbi:kinesin-like protein KIFC1 [Pristis pectinata]|uniref:kinesin-like protein KIFC1 n=1 Tax=Pristis pectinata TaxID=685728 RepID=UPI00223DE2DB|nr:kinesin-like protein KIFC1 [Pristis pectinata]XP_051899654.1 kinesin-like protein KIFC1 [Pristis pectinata]
MDERKDLSADFRSLAKKRKVQDENAENINGSTVNKNLSLQRSRLPQPSLKRMELTTAVARTNPASTVKKVGFSSVSLSTSRSKLVSSIPGKGVKNQYGARQAMTVKGTGTRPPTTATVSTSTGAVSKKRPAWDLKGQLEDMKKRMSEYSGRLQISEQQRKEFQESVGLHSKHLSAANSRNKELEDKLQALESLVQSRESELEKYQRENAALQEVLQLCETQIGSLTAEVEDLSTVTKDLKATLLCKEEELVQKTSCVEEQQKVIANQEEKLQRMERALTNLELERRRLHNTVQELKGNIRVICRVRPLLELEGGNDIGHIQFLPSDEKAITLLKQQESRIGHNRKEDVKYNFSFDRVFQPVAKQEQVFEDISQLVQSALDGYNVCIFAYGQTGSGKTYTMEGPDDLTPETRGMIPRAVEQLFFTARKLETVGWVYKFTASFLEIYNETIRDLLVTKPEKNIEYEIKQLSSTSQQLHVTNLKYIGVNTEEEVYRLIAIAKANRSVAKTAMNDRSSRSHSVFQLHVEGTDSTHGLQCTSTLCLVDLAGSERLDKSHSKGDRLREAQAINTSLSCLGHVIMSLSNKESHIPYRNSKLTYLLQNSLGGNSKMLMFVNVSPLEENFSESVNTLRFARQVNECMIGTAQMNRRHIV